MKIANEQFIVASHDMDIFKKNVGRSGLFTKHYPFTIVIGYNNIPKAYNDATYGKEGSILIYAHHDVYFPPAFMNQVYMALNWLENANWGVLGVAGVDILNGIRVFKGHIEDRGKQWGEKFYMPLPVQTLDELLLITHGDFTFDENLPLHFYGADICMQAIAQGKTNYVIPAFVHHNSSYNGIRTTSYHACLNYFREKWKDYLPVATTTTAVK